MADRYNATKRAIRENDPPIEINQRWVAYDHNGAELRVVRILAPYPYEEDEADEHKYWIVKEEPSKLYRSTSLDIKICQEFNLRYVFQLRQG